MRERKIERGTDREKREKENDSSPPNKGLFQIHLHWSVSSLPLAESHPLVTEKGRNKYRY